jgi:hypothetical protein
MLVDERVKLIIVGAPLLLEGQKTMAGEKGTASERSFVMVCSAVDDFLSVPRSLFLQIKPDGVSRQLVGKVSSSPSAAQIEPVYSYS